MPKIGNHVPASELPCSRCNSKKRVSKKWTEKVPNFSGYMVLYHTEFKCTNKECQEEFDKLIAADNEKR